MSCCPLTFDIQWPDLVQRLPPDWVERLKATECLPPNWPALLASLPPGWLQVMSRAPADWATLLRFDEWSEILPGLPQDWPERLSKQQRLPDDFEAILASIPHGWMSIVAQVMMIRAGTEAV